MAPLTSTNGKASRERDQRATKPPKEHWKPIDGFAYEVSDQGRVRSLPRRLRKAGERGSGSIAGRILKGRPNRRGHLRVTLCGDGLARCVSVSRLVASYFVPNPDSLPFVRHKDFDRGNNIASNLQWCDQRESIERALAGERFTARVSPRRAKRLDGEAAQTIYDMRAAGMTFKDIALAFDVGLEAVKGVCYGETWRDPSRPSLARDPRAWTERIHAIPKCCAQDYELIQGSSGSA